MSTSTQTNDHRLSSRNGAPFSIIRTQSDIGVHNQENLLKRIVQVSEVAETFPELFDEIWLTTLKMTYKSDVHKEWAKILKSAYNALQGSGMKIALQIGCTLGHGDPGGSDPREESLPLSELMWDGKLGEQNPVPSSPYCINSEIFREHLSKNIEIYLKEFTPYVVFIDDDIRLELHGPFLNGCFCPRCLKKFAEFSGREWSCTELYQELTDRSKASAVRKQWTDFNSYQLADFLEFVGKEVHKHAPDCIMALEEANPTGQYNGQDRSPIYHALERSTGQKTHIRVGGGAWNDFVPWELLRKGFLQGTAANMAKASGSVAMTYCEMENFPRAALTKSPHGIALECALSTAYGVQGLTLTLSANLAALDKAFTYPLFDCLNRWIPYLKTLSTGWEGSRFDGITMVQPENNLSERVFQEYESRNPNWWCVMFSDELQALTSSGVPAAWERSLAKSEELPALLTMECVEGLSEEEFYKMRQRGVLMTGAAFEYLQNKNMTSFTGVKSLPGKTGFTLQAMTDHPFNEGFAGELWPPTTGGLSWEYEISPDSKAQVLLRRQSPTGETADTFWILESEDGGRMAVYGASKSFTMHHNPSSMHQLFEVLDWLGKRKMPARLDTYAQVALIPFASQKSGKLRGVTLVNSGIQVLEQVKIFIRNPESSHIRCYIPGEEPRWVNAVPTGVPGEYHLTLPGLAAWSVMTVFCNA